MSKRNNFSVRVANKTLKYRTAELYSNALRTLAQGQFKNRKEQLEAIKKLPNGFEYVISEKKESNFKKQFNNIEFDD
jgi:hypothetical protein